MAKRKAKKSPQGSTFGAPGPVQMKTCGSCYAGICLMNETEIQRCDTCKIFETDEDAAAAVQALLELLQAEYTRPGVDPDESSCADAFQRIEAKVKPPLPAVKSASLEKRRLKSQVNTSAMEERINAAFDSVDLWAFEKPEDYHGAVFEHGQWWITSSTGAQWSVVDATGGDSVDGFGFEQVSEAAEE